MRNPRVASALLVLLVSASLPGLAQEAGSRRPLYIIFDGSNSMWGELPDASRKIEVAKEVFRDLDASLFRNRDVALRIYGHRRAGDCSDSELAVPFGAAEDALSTMADRIDGVTPRGKTPITRSLQAAQEDFGDREGDILLISDGIETCDPDPCDLVQDWHDSGIDIRVHVVGLGLTDMARGAMQCIADASGTTYLDAQSAQDLGKAIEQAAASDPPEPGDARPQPPSPSSEFRLAGQDPDGNFVPVRGSLTNASGESVDVASNGRFVFEAGTYTLQAGVPTVNGVIYEPVTQEVQVAATGRTRIVVTVPRPPIVTTRFVESDIDISGPITRAYVDGRDIFGLRPGEEHFVLPGTYELRARLNEDNDLRVTATIVAGEDREVVFEAVKTVRVKLVVTPDGADRALRQHQELVQNGDVVYTLHYNNGGDGRPGVYTVRADHVLTPFLIEGVVIGDEERQTIDLTVPYGVAQIQYLFKTEAPTTDLRCWLERLDEAGDRVARSSALQCASEDLYLAAGHYRVRTWDRLGDFETVEFDAEVGATAVVAVSEK